MQENSENVRKNLILITIDCLRYDIFSNLLRHNLLPNIASITQKGLFFTRAYAVSSWTPPSVVSLLTSSYPFMYGGYLNFSPRIPFPKILARHDYITISCQTNAWLTRYFNFHKGFTVFVDDFSKPINKRRKNNQNIRNILKRISFLRLLRHKLRATPYDFLIDMFEISFLGKEINAYLTADELNKGALSLLERTIQKFGDKKPIFFWIHYMDAHEPFSPLYEGLWDKVLALKIFKKISRKISLSEKELDFIKERYIKSILRIDKAIGDLIEGLTRFDITFENTIFVITSDHGQEFFEHGIFGHGEHLYEELIHVPLIITCPETKARKVNEPVSLIDLAPTLLSLLGIIDRPANYKGLDLSEAIFNNRPFSEKRIIISEDTMRGNINARKHRRQIIRFDEKCRRIACIYDTWKYILNPDNSEELYNLKKDPMERENLAEEEQSIKKMLRKKILEHIEMEKKTHHLQRLYLRILQMKRQSKSW